MTVEVPIEDLQKHLQNYRAEPLPEYSNNKRHVYFLRHTGQYITVRRVGKKAELEFTTDCPCSYDD